METEEETDPIDGSIKESIDCFRDKNRVCGPDCVAWVTNPVKDKSRLTFTQRHCLELSSTERTARHTTIIASTLAELLKKTKTAEQDRKRSEALGGPQPTGPFGNPFPTTPGKKS